MSMYIYANLPEPYGTFNQIRKDNYPFNRLFPKYLRTLVKLARDMDLDVFSLLGYVENELAEDDRLPDLPVTEERLSFRFPIDDEFIEDYYREQDLTNKMITQMIIRTTIRLSEVYGTSLSRIGTLITNIDRDIDRDIVKPTSKIKDKVRLRDRESLPTKVVISKPAKTSNKSTKQEDDEFDGPSRDDLLKKIDELTKKGSELVERSGKIELPNDEEDVDSKVVETNPHLLDFL